MFVTSVEVGMVGLCAWAVSLSGGFPVGMWMDTAWVKTGRCSVLMTPQPNLRAQLSPNYSESVPSYVDWK